jgi:hypothetical protein
MAIYHGPFISRSAWKFPAVMAMGEAMALWLRQLPLVATRARLLGTTRAVEIRGPSLVPATQVTPAWVVADGLGLLALLSFCCWRRTAAHAAAAERRMPMRLAAATQQSPGNRHMWAKPMALKQP